MSEKKEYRLSVIMLTHRFKKVIDSVQLMYTDSEAKRALLEDIIRKEQCYPEARIFINNKQSIVHETQSGLLISEKHTFEELQNFYDFEISKLHPDLETKNKEYSCYEEYKENHPWKIIETSPSLNDKTFYLYDSASIKNLVLSLSEKNPISTFKISHNESMRAEIKDGKILTDIDLIPYHNDPSYNVQYYIQYWNSFNTGEES